MAHELADKYLDQAEELLDQKIGREEFLQVIEQAEKISPDDVSILCRTARILFRFGLLNSKGSFFFIALDKLKVAEELDPLFFKNCFIWRQLWGNILVQIGKLVEDASFFETALHQFALASQCGGEYELDLYWDWGEAWNLLGQKSGEPSDFQYAILKFRYSFELGMRSPFFLLDYASALMFYSRLIGDLPSLEEGIRLLQEVITETFQSQDAPSFALRAAWRKLTQAMKLRYQLSQKNQHFDEADAAFKEALLSTEKSQDLWLEWADLYLYSGWIKREIKLVESGFEKLTSPKIKECDPIRVSALLGSGLVMFGIFLENLKFLKDGRERIKSALDLLPNQPQLLFALGFADFGHALYFSDATMFAQAISVFEKGLAVNSSLAENWHLLFQCYLSYGLLEEDPSLIQKGIKAIARLSEIRPYSAHHLNEWGISLLRLKKFLINSDDQQTSLEEAIDKFRKASELYDDEEIWFNWGCALDFLGDLTGEEEYYERAIDLLSRSLEKRPSQLHARYHLGLALSHLGELTLNVEYLTQAVELLESIVKIDQDDENIWCDLGYAHLNLAEVIFDVNLPEQGELQRREAERALVRAAELGCGSAFYHLACLYSLSNFCETALSFLKRAQAADALPSVEDLENDEWLENVRKMEGFQEFLMQRENNESPEH